MARTTSGSGPISPWGPGQENTNYNVLFDEGSTEDTSHVFTVDNNFVRVAAFNLAPGDIVTIEQVTGLAAGDKVADYAPVHGPVTLYYNSASDQRTSYILERAGRYRAKLSSGIGLVHVYAIQYFIENEASQDIADALYAVLAITPCTFGQKIPRNQPTQDNVVGLDDNGCLVDFPLEGPATPCSLGAAIPDGSFTPGSGDFNGLGNVVVKNGAGCLIDNQFISSANGNLLQLKTDGAYYGIAPPPNFVNQYVSSSTGVDHDGASSPADPLLTIQKAISNLPDGTLGNIFLLAGDIFHTYPTATGDVINTLTFQQGANQNDTLNIGNRIVSIFPYNDPAVTAIRNYNTANSTGYNTYIAQQTNFPEIHVTISQSTDNPTYVVLGFTIGNLGSIHFYATKFVMGSTGTANPPYFHSGIVGTGEYGTQGGYVVLSEIPVLGLAGGSGQLSVSPYQTPVIVQTAFAFQPRYAVLGTQVLMVTSLPISSGGLIVPALTYTNTGDFMEQIGGFPSTTPYPGASYSYVSMGGVGSAPLWQNIVIYDHTVRAYRRISTAIDIQV